MKAAKRKKTREEWLDSLKRILIAEKQGEPLVDVEIIEENSVSLQENSVPDDGIQVTSFEERVYKQIQPLAGFGVKNSFFCNFAF